MRMGGKSVAGEREPSRAVHEPAGPLVAARAGAQLESLASAGSWGWLPALVVFAALGLILVSQSMRLAEATSRTATPLFWLGLLLIYAPIAFRSALPQVSPDATALRWRSGSAWRFTW